MRTDRLQEESVERRDESRRPVVLLVDDLPDNLLALEDTLERDDIDIVTARSGHEALELLLETEVALAILDVQMPEMDGYELASLMRGVERTRYIPIIFVTAGSREQADVFHGYDAGAVDYLFKPIDERVLRSKVDVFVTLERQRQALVEANRMREMFVAVLGHDLRSPLNGVLLSARLLEQRSDHDEAVVGRIRRGGERMARMIEQLLDATRFRQDGSITLQTEPTDLRELTEQILSELDHEPGRSQFEAVGDTVGTCDRDRILQVLSNLVGNATNHSPPDSPIQIQIDGRDEDALTVAVQNRGDPIPRASRSSLFEPFRRAGPGHAGDAGLGLGLFITKKLVEAHGGAISFTSDEEAGTCFVVTLPRHVGRGH